MLIRTTVTRCIGSHSRRDITSSYLKDVWRTKSFSPDNPLITALETETMPDWSRIQPHHVPTAVEHFQQEASKMASHDIQRVDAMQGKFDSLQQIVSFFSLTSSEKWQACDGFTPEQQELIYMALLKQPPPTITTDAQTKYATTQWIRAYEQRTGAHLSQDEEFKRMTQALQEIETKFQVETKSLQPAHIQQLLGNMYNYLGIQGRLAELLGYTSYAERVMETRMARIEQLHTLHAQIAERILPILVGSSTKKNTVLDEYLSNTQPRESALQRDKANMLRLEHHVTLDGTLEFIKRLSLELFGLSLVEEKEETAAWDKDVRLFHVFDELHHEKRQLGSFFLDPHSRNGKISRPFTSPLLHRSQNRLPVVVLSMGLEPPAWDTDATPMTWKDVETLFHEMAHVYQIVAAQTSLGTLLGAHNLELDLSELLPKYMEHWMTEPSTIYTLMTLSKPSRTVGFANEAEMNDSIEAALRVRSNEKAWQLAQLAFFGELELTLFSSFDIRGDESLLNFQNRLAAKFSPHDLPDKKDITPLLQIFRENANGRAVAWYRYLWCDVLSASMFKKSKSIYASKDNGNPLQGMIRRTILEPGVMMDSAEILREFEMDEIISPDDLLKLYNL